MSEDQQIKRYKSKIKYLTENYIEYDSYAYSQEQADAFALVCLRETNRSECINPEIVKQKTDK